MTPSYFLVQLASPYLPRLELLPEHNINAAQEKVNDDNTELMPEISELNFALPAITQSNNT